MRIIRRTGFLLLFLLFASCDAGDPVEPRGEAPSPTPAPSPVSFDGTWELAEGHAPEGPIETTERWRITLSIDGKSFGGLSACNHYGLRPKLHGNTISIGGVGGTDIDCHRKVVETEARYHSALVAAETISRTGDRLVIAGPESQLVYTLVPPPPTRKLTDVRWELRSLIHGRGPDARTTAVSPAHPAYVYFHRDGTFESDTGCREFVGKWVQGHDRISFTQLGAKDILATDCADKLMEQEDAILSLGDTFTFEIEGRTLTAYGRFSKLGLEFRATR